MTLFKCKMCGGALEINDNETVATCEYCGTQQTLPKLNDDKRANMYDRANHFRRNNEFDKAMGIYEQILNEDNTDAEAYWSLVLCRYGIEYVEDPATHKRIPTVNRAQFTSVFDDDNYKSALKYADGYQRNIYEEEAKTINEIQKGILAISQKEEPFDVFICYKETDNNGRRTPDSVLANDLYHQLTQEGFKVFFARITLEDKLGTAYEPYIFAALNSAKVMVVLGTKPEYFKAVWVRNEWSRYLALIKQGQKKMLIPAYKDMDPYDLPEEFSHLQAQDMSKLGFMQDLIRGIKKIAEANTPKVSVVKETVHTAEATNTAPLLKRAFMFLEDGEFERADDFCEQVLNQEPENAMAYIGKLMAELRVKKQEDLAECSEPFDTYNNYQKALRFGNSGLKTELCDYIEKINVRNENFRLNRAYNDARQAMHLSKTEDDYKKAGALFKKISEYMDSATLVRECYNRAAIAKKDEILAKANSKMIGENISNYEEAIELFMSISGWKDADRKVYICKKKIEDIKKMKKRKSRKLSIALIAAVIVFLMCIAFLVSVFKFFIPNSKYNEALDLMENGEIDEAYRIFQELGDFRDSIDKRGSIRLKKTKDGLKYTTIGSYITFGEYEQDANLSNGKEKIWWRVLDVKDNKILVVSKYALDCMQYDSKNDDMPWETSTIREWLNNYFMETSFCDDEQSMIFTETQDEVFLLSVDEADMYFSSNTDRMCVPTDYAVASGASSNGTCWWWLRSPGIDQIHMASVSLDGIVYKGGNGIGYSGAIRPALWIDLDFFYE